LTTLAVSLSSNASLAPSRRRRCECPDRLSGRYAHRADAAASGLSNSRILVFPGAAHDVLIWSPDCAVTIMRNFLNQPQGGYDDSCLRSVTEPPFKAS
jgi:pimeloyl-ACP methyl ester carboxylesterase